MSTFAQISAATTAASRSPELPASVFRNARIGALRSRVHTVRPRPIDEAVLAASATEARATSAGCHRRFPCCERSCRCPRQVTGFVLTLPDFAPRVVRAVVVESPGGAAVGATWSRANL
jgi:hypothetical protein